MQLSVTFRHMDATDALKTYARDRMERIKKYFPDPISCHVVMSTERGFNHRVDVNVQLHNGLQVAGHETTENMYSSIDLVIAKIERQVRRYKGKLNNHQPRHEIRPVEVEHTVLHQPEADRAAAASLDEHEQEKEPVFNVVKREKFHAKPLGVMDAIMQLNLLHQEFLVFRNQESGKVNVVYAREDGSYGLIDPSDSEG